MATKWLWIYSGTLRYEFLLVSQSNFLHLNFFFFIYFLIEGPKARFTHSTKNYLVTYAFDFALRITCSFSFIILCDKGSRVLNGIQAEAWSCSCHSHWRTVQESVYPLWVCSLASFSPLPLYTSYSASSFRKAPFHHSCKLAGGCILCLIEARENARRIGAVNRAQSADLADTVIPHISKQNIS